MGKRLGALGISKVTVEAEGLASTIMYGPSNLGINLRLSFRQTYTVDVC